MQHHSTSGNSKEELNVSNAFNHNTSSSKLPSSTISADDESLIENSRGETHREEKKLTKSQVFKLYWTYLRPTVLMLIINVGIPLALYYILKIWLTPLVALIISGIPPLLHVFYVFWKKRRIDVLGCIFVAGFIISAVLSAISGKFSRYSILLDHCLTHFS